MADGMKGETAMDGRGRPVRQRRFVVVGGGVSGLVAAWRLVRQHGSQAEVLVLESSPQVGGKLRVGQVGDVTVDLGAESVLARRPEAVDLFHELGLDEDTVHPRAASASVLSRGKLYPLPPATT